MGDCSQSDTTVSCNNGCLW